MNDLRKIVYGGEIFLPETIEEIENIVKGNAHIRIGNANAEGVIISLEKLDKILEINREKKEVYLETGIVLSDLQKRLEKYNLELPIDILFKETIQIGQLLALNSSGKKGIKYGKIGDWVKEIEIIDSEGNLVKVGKTDLSDFLGMEGITGIMVRARLKLINKIRRTASLLKIEKIENVVESVKKIKLMQNVSMICFFDKQSSELLGLDRNYHLLIEFESEKGNLKNGKYKEILEIQRKLYDQLCLLGNTKLEDIKLFLDKLPDFIKYTENNKIPVFGSLGTGILHPVLNEKDDSLDILKNVKRIRGKVYGDFGSKNKKEFFDDNDIKLIKRMKQRNDPINKFNKGVMIDFEDGKIETTDRNRKISNDDLNSNN